jgi:hypothetical protein
MRTWLLACILGLHLLACDEATVCAEGERCSAAAGTAGPAGSGAAAGAGAEGGASSSRASVGNGGASSSTAAGSGGAGGGAAPSVPPCFPAGSDDFDDPLVSAAIWPDATNTEFTGDAAALGVAPSEFALLTQSADTPDACFVSFVMTVTEQGHGYLLVSPQSPTDALDDLDVEVTIDSVRLYTRGGLPVNTDAVDRFGDRFLLLVGADRAVLHGALADDSGWMQMSELDLPPFPTVGRVLRLIKYDDQPPLTVDDVNILSPALLASFPSPP